MRTLLTAFDNLEEVVDAYVGRATVGFGDEREPGGASRGSGVLVRLGKVQGVLTCAHVVSDLLCRDQVSLVCNGASRSRLQKIVLEPRNLRHIHIRGIGAAEDGPDLGFIQLPPPLLATAGALGSIVDLEQQLKVYNRPLGAGSTEEVAIAAGVVAEWTKEQDSDICRIVMLTTWLAAGKLQRQGQREAFDLLRFDPDRMTEIPASFAGMSGGGLWLLGLVKDDNGIYRVADGRLAGVAYYQTEDRAIIGHGPRSIYEVLVREMEKLS